MAKQAAIAKIAVVAVMVTVFCRVSGQLSFDDPCNVMPAGSDMTEEGGEVSAPAQCSKGNVWWNYPRGYLNVTFPGDGSQRFFKVCLAGMLGPLVSNITQLVGTQSISVTSPTQEGQEVCLPQAGQSVTVRLAQPPFLTYMTLYDFTLHYQ